MSPKTDIYINSFQLNILLNDEKKRVYKYLIENGIWCTTCQEICTEGVKVEEIYLTRLNDIKIHGTCNKCEGKVTRVVEFGEDREFYQSADKFRESIE